MAAQAEITHRINKYLFWLGRHYINVFETNRSVGLSGWVE